MIVNNHLSIRHRWLPLLALALFLLASPSFAAAKKPAGATPEITGLFPAGGQVGTTFSCKVEGTLAKVETTAWTDHPGLVFKPTAKPDTFEVTLAPDLPPGPRLVRFFNGDGASAPRIFMVGRHGEGAEVEPNDEARKPQAIPALPVTLNGRLDKAEDADVFAVRVEAGRWLVCELQGYALGSPMDPALKILDERGVELAGSHDTHNLDPFIAFEVKKTGLYLVQVMAFAHPPAADIALKGSAQHIYRLTLTDQAHARVAWPPAVTRGQPGSGRLLGWNLGSQMEGSEQSIDPAQASATAGDEETVRVPTPNGEPVLAALVTPPVTREAEPNQETAQAQRIPLPGALAGRMDAPGDEDRYLFTAKKGESLEFRVRAATLHSPLDAWLRIEDKERKNLAQADDGKDGGFDPALKWKPPADGDYVLAIGDVLGRGGWEYVYAIGAMAAGGPSLTATLDATAYKLEPGKTAEIKLTAKVSGEFKGKLIIRAEGLPPGVSASETELPAKDGEVKLTLTASAEAAPANQPFAITIATSDPDAPQTFRAAFKIPFTEPRGDLLINEDSRVWLTVTGKEAEPAPAG